VVPSFQVGARGGQTSCPKAAFALTKGSCKFPFRGIKSYQAGKKGMSRTAACKHKLFFGIPKGFADMGTETEAATG